MKINFAKHKIKPGNLTAATVKNNFKGAIERFAASNNAFYLWVHSKEPRHTVNSFIDTLAMVSN